MQDKHSLPWHHAQICVTRNFNLFAGNMTCDLVGGEGGVTTTIAANFKNLGAITALLKCGNCVCCAYVYIGS